LAHTDIKGPPITIGAPRSLTIRSLVSGICPWGAVRGPRGVGRENAGGHSVQPGFPLLPEGGGPFRSQKPGVCRKTAQSALGQVDSSTLVNDSTPIRRKLLHVRDLSAPKSRRLTSMKVSTWLRGNCDSPCCAFRAVKALVTLKGFAGSSPVLQPIMPGFAGSSPVSGLRLVGRRPRTGFAGPLRLPGVEACFRLPRDITW